MPPEAVDIRPTGEEAHLRALEALYDSAPVNRLFQSRLVLPDAGRSEIRFTVSDESFHAAGAAHGTLYFKMLDDAAFYAANGLVSDRFLLTTAFNLHFTKPMRVGRSAGRGTLDFGQAAGVRRRGADRRFRRRGMRPRHRHLHALAHRPVRPRRLSHELMAERLPGASRSGWPDPPGRGRGRVRDHHQARRCGPRRLILLIVRAGASIRPASNARWTADGIYGWQTGRANGRRRCRKLWRIGAKNASALMKIYG